MPVNMNVRSEAPREFFSAAGRESMSSLCLRTSGRWNESLIYLVARVKRCLFFWSPSPFENELLRVSLRQRHGEQNRTFQQEAERNRESRLTPEERLTLVGVTLDSGVAEGEKGASLEQEIADPSFKRLNQVVQERLKRIIYEFFKFPSVKEPLTSTGEIAKTVPQHMSHLIRCSMEISSDRQLEPLQLFLQGSFREAQNDVTKKETLKKALQQIRHFLLSDLQEKSLQRDELKVALQNELTGTIGPLSEAISAVNLSRVLEWFFGQRGDQAPPVGQELWWNEAQEYREMQEKLFEQAVMFLFKKRVERFQLAFTAYVNSIDLEVLLRDELLSPFMSRLATFFAQRGALLMSKKPLANLIDGVADLLLSHVKALKEVYEKGEVQRPERDWPLLLRQQLFASFFEGKVAHPLLQQLNLAHGDPGDASSSAVEWKLRSHCRQQVKQWLSILCGTQTGQSSLLPLSDLFHWPDSWLEMGQLCDQSGQLLLPKEIHQQLTSCFAETKLRAKESFLQFLEELLIGEMSDKLSKALIHYSKRDLLYAIQIDYILPALERSLLQFLAKRSWEELPQEMKEASAHPTPDLDGIVSELIQPYSLSNQQRALLQGYLRDEIRVSSATKEAATDSSAPLEEASSSSLKVYLDLLSELLWELAGWMREKAWFGKSGLEALWCSDIGQSALNGVLQPIVDPYRRDHHQAVNQMTAIVEHIWSDDAIDGWLKRLFENERSPSIDRRVDQEAKELFHETANKVAPLIVLALRRSGCLASWATMAGVTPESIAELIHRLVDRLWREPWWNLNLYLQLMQLATAFITSETHSKPVSGLSSLSNLGENG